MNREKNFGERFADLIIEKAVTIDELSKDAGTLKSEVYHWRAGDYLPSFKNLVKLANYFCCSLDFLIGTTEINDVTTFNTNFDFAKSFAQILAKKTITIYRISKDLGMDGAMMYAWLNGEYEPQLDSLIRLATYFDCTIDYLIGREK